MALNHRRLDDDSYKDLCCTQKYYQVCSTSSCISLCKSICEPPPYQSLYPPPPPPPITTSSFPHQPHKLSLPLSISLAIFATTFFLFTCYTIYKCFTCWRMRRRSTSTTTRGSPSEALGSRRETEETHDHHFLDEDHGPVVDHPIWYIRTIGLQQSLIDSIAVVKYKRSDGVVDGTECSVCLSEFREDETLRLLPKCNHAFHVPCIDTWLRSHTNCPMCRAGIVAANAAASPLPAPSPQNSGVGEEIQEGSSENTSGFGRERGHGVSELRITIEEDEEEEEEEGGELRAENGLSNENSKEEMEGVQPMRRSVSLDFLSASMISLAVANDLREAQSSGNSSTQLVKADTSNAGIVRKRLDVNQSLLRLMSSSSIGRSMKRSVSCSGKLFLSRGSRSRNCVLPR